MTSATISQQNLLRQIVRGERPLSELPSLDIRWHLEGDRCWVENGNHLSLVLGPTDLAAGLLAYANDPEQLRDWALFLQAAPIDLDVEQHPSGEVLLEALGNAAFQIPPSEEVLAQLAQLIQQNGHLP